MKSTSSLWNSPNIGADNFSGFSALPGGYRGFTGTFFDIGGTAFFWSTTESEYSASNAYYRYLRYSDIIVNRSEYGFPSKPTGLSIRCLKD
jgi:uncharacterized protein (TIGR02145 family)